MAHKNVIYVVFSNARKAGRLELVLGGSFCQLHKFLPTTAFPKVQMHTTRLEIKSALEKNRHMQMRRFHKHYVHTLGCVFFLLFYLLPAMASILYV